MPVLYDVDEVAPDTPKAVDVAFFGTALQHDNTINVSQGKPSSLRLHIAQTVATILEYTVDNGTHWIEINDGDAIPANVGKVFLIPIKPTSQVNLRNKTTSTIIICEIDEIRENS